MLHRGEAMTPVTVLSWPLALAAARALGHRPGPQCDFGVIQLVSCTVCNAAMVERSDDGAGVTGEAIEKPCKGKP